MFGSLFSWQKWQTHKPFEINDVCWGYNLLNIISQQASLRIWVLWMVIDHTDFALTTVAYLLACVHGYGAVIWAIGNYIFCHYRINCVAAMILTLSLVALAVMDISCGPAGHHECYVKCFTFPGGHYLLAFVPIFFAYTLLLGDVFLGTFFHVFFEFGCLGR